MCLQIYSALLLDSFKGSWDICFSPGSCISYILFFFLLHYAFQKAISQEEWFQFNLQIIRCFFFPPKIKRLNNLLTLIQAELGTMYGHMCRDPDFRNTALGCSVSAVQSEHISYLVVSEPGHCSGVGSQAPWKPPGFGKQSKRHISAVRVVNFL